MLSQTRALRGTVARDFGPLPSGASDLLGTRPPHDRSQAMRAPLHRRPPFRRIRTRRGARILPASGGPRTRPRRSPRTSRPLNLRLRASRPALRLGVGEAHGLALPAAPGQTLSCCSGARARARTSAMHGAMRAQRQIIGIVDLGGVQETADASAKPALSPCARHVLRLRWQPCGCNQSHPARSNLLQAAPEWRQVSGI